MELLHRRTQPEVVAKAEEGQARKSLFSVHGEDIMTPMYQMEDVLDMAAYYREFNRLGDRMELAQRAMDRDPMLLFTKKETDRLAGLEGRAKTAHDLVSDLNTELGVINEGGEMTILNMQVIHVHLLGTMLTHRAISEKLKAFARSNGSEAGVAYYEFQHKLLASELALRIGEASLGEFIDSKLEPEELPRFYNLFVNAQLIRLYRLHDDVLPYNQESFFGNSPNIIKENAESATAKASALLSCPPSVMEQVVRQTTGVSNEAALQAKRISEHMQEFRQKLEQAIFNPDSAGFPELQSMMEELIAMGFHEKILALQPFVLTEISELVNFYRLARAKSSGEAEQAPFYALLADTAREYADEIPAVIGVLTQDDVATLLIDEEKSDVPQASLSSLRKAAIKLFNLSSQTDYDFGTSDIGWGGLVPPQDAQLRFKKGTPLQFSVALSYMNDAGENNEVIVQYDTKKGIMDWSFLEAPDDVVMKPMYDQILVTTDKMLAQAYLMAELQTAERRSKRSVRNYESSIMLNQSPAIPIFEPEAQMPRRRHKRSPHSVQTEQLNPVGQPEPGEVRNVVITPEAEEFEDLVRHLSAEDRRIIQSGIEEYNARGVGQFKRLKGLSIDGEIQYILRINTTVRGGVRVLLEEVTSAEGIRSFAIVDIDNRKDIYRKNK